MFIFLGVTSEDKVLVERARNGDRGAFEKLVRSCAEDIMRLAYGLTRNMTDSEDLFQEAFIKAYKSIGSFRGASSFSVWVYRIAVNRWKDREKQKRPGRVVSFDASLMRDSEGNEKSMEEILPDGKRSPEKELELNENHRVYIRALEWLEEDERTVIILKDEDGKLYREIAQILNIPVGTVKSRLANARGKLRKIFFGMKNEKKLR